MMMIMRQAKRLSLDTTDRKKVWDKGSVNK